MGRLQSNDIHLDLRSGRSWGEELPPTVRGAPSACEWLVTLQPSRLIKAGGFPQRLPGSLLLGEMTPQEADRWERLSVQ